MAYTATSAARLRIVVIAALMLSSLAGCGGVAHRYRPEPFAPIERGAMSRPLRTVAIVASQHDPFLDFHALTRKHEGNQPERAVGGVALGAGVGLTAGALAVLACLNPFALATCAPVGGFVLGGAALGGGIGLATSQPNDARSAQEIANSRVAAETALREVTLQRLLQAAVAARTRSLPATVFTESAIAGPAYLDPTRDVLTRDYAPLAADGLDAVLELALQRAAMSPAELMGGAAVTMTARARLVRASNNTVLYRGEYTYTSERFKPQQWTENNAQRLRQALRSGLDDLAGQVASGAFLPERGISGK